MQRAADGVKRMKIGEVALMTKDVVRLAAFYKWLLGAENGSSDEGHQVILAEETVLAVCFDDSVGENGGNICLAFTVENVDKEYERLRERGVKIIDPPTARPWGMKNMSFLDPDGNRVYFRSMLK